MQPAMMETVSASSQRQVQLQPQRHFGTIGIEDVFLDCPDPPHFFPRSYCNSDHTGTCSATKTAVQRPFMTSEIIGYIKETPEDFCVREIAKPCRLVEIVGEKYYYEELSHAERRAWQVADLVELNSINQNLNVTTHKIDSTKRDGDGQIISNGGGSLDTKETTTRQPAVLATHQAEAASAIEKQELSPLETIELVLEHVLIDHHNKKEEALAAIRSLQDRALEVIQPLKHNALKEGPYPQAALTSEENNTTGITLPSIPKNFAHLEGANELLADLDRGSFHRAFRLEFPLLKTDTMPDQTIQVSIDDFFHDLVPFLHCPEEDLPRLYKFQKIGCVMDNNDSKLFSSRYNNHHSNKKRKRDRQSPQKEEKTAPDNNSNGNTDPILRLRPDLTKDERRPLHRMIQQKNRAFQTKTLSSSNNNDTTTNTTTAILVHWDPGAQKRARQKQKSKKNARDGTKSSVATATDNNNIAKADDDPTPKNIMCVLKKREKEHLTAINNLCAAVKCRTSDVGLAGIKDMKAVTYQFCTIRNCRPSRLLRAVPALADKGIGIGTIREVPTEFFLNNGDLEGNNFEIVIRELQRVKVVESDGNSAVSAEDFIPCEKIHIQVMFERVQKYGFVNYYGEQRVGSPGDSAEVGVRTFDVGKAMLQGDFTKAIDLLMTGRMITYRGVAENSDEAKVRRVWQETGGDPAATLKVFPKGESLPRERAVMKGLRRYGKSDPLAAIKCLPYNVRRFWINAYQSLVWNFMVSARLRRFGSSSAVLGDLFLEDSAATINDVQLVDASNLPFVSLSQVVLPLPGYGVQYPENEIGDLYKEMLKKDSINFDKKSPDEGTAKGSYRHLIAKADNMQLETVEDGDDPSFVSSVKVSFDLPAGSYATMLLREMMLTTVARD